MSTRWVAVAEEHRPRARSAVTSTRRTAPIGAGAQQARAPEYSGYQRRRVVDQQRHAARAAGGDHAVGVGQGGGDGLLAEDAPDAGLDGVDDDLGVAVVRGDDAEQVGPLAGQHLPVVGVGLRLGEALAPLAAEALERLRQRGRRRPRRSVARLGGVGGDVGVGRLAAQHRVGGGRRRVLPDPGQADDGGAVRVHWRVLSFLSALRGRPPSDRPAPPQGVVHRDLERRAETGDGDPHPVSVEQDDPRATHASPYAAPRCPPRRRRAGSDAPGAL